MTEHLGYETLNPSDILHSIREQPWGQRNKFGEHFSNAMTGARLDFAIIVITFILSASLDIVSKKLA